ncbi:MAG: PhoPQ-activated protein PqaA family protein [Verrucomicrobiota bacterium]|jgi:PhoPQ-activated pathogenicity-related protein
MNQTINCRPGQRQRPAALAVAAVAWLLVVPTWAGALEDYVRKPDPSFQWKRTEQRNITNATLTHLEFVSQTWRGQFWSHHLLVIRPSEIRQPRYALLFITGGSYGAPDDRDAAMFKMVAERAGALVGILNHVPNQPLYDGRHEDALIAYTFDQYMKTGDKTWPLLFPMVKSAVRAMDTMQQFAQKEWGQKVDSFVVTGASKRGWTTWLTGAVDPRVKAIAPMVIDMLNMKAQLNWSQKVYGKQSDEISDYTKLGLHLEMDEPAMVKLRSWVDPYSYRRRYTMPKLLLLGTNDPYWTVDALRHYWTDLLEPKLIFQTPNAGHDLDGGKEAIKTLATFFELVAGGKPLPKLDWQFWEASAGVKILVKADQPVRKFTLWTADSTDRDFRDDKWTSRELAVEPGNQATTEVARPGTGYRAYLGEATLVSPSGHEYRLSTAARVTPDTQP